MGIAYRHDKKIGLSVSVWDGVVTTEQRQKHIAALESDPDWGTYGLLLTDLTGISAERRPSAKQVLEAASEFAARLAPKVREAKWAMVAGETFVLAQRFGTYLEEEMPRLIVFNDLATASTWLGVNSAEVGTILDELRADIRAAGPSSESPQS